MVVDVMEHKQDGNLVGKKPEELEVLDLEGISLCRTHLVGSIGNKHSATLPFAHSFHPQHRRGWEI